MTLPTAIKEALARADTSTLYLMAMEFAHSSFPGGVFRLVGFDEDLSVDGDVYAGIGAESQAPAIGIEPDNSLSMQIDNTVPIYQHLLAFATIGTEPINVTVKPFVFNLKTDTVIDVTGAYTFQVKTIVPAEDAVVLQLGNKSPANISFPSKLYSPESHPALYR